MPHLLDGVGLLQKLSLGSSGPKELCFSTVLEGDTDAPGPTQPSSPCFPPGARGCQRVRCERSSSTSPPSYFLPHPGSEGPGLCLLLIVHQQASLLPERAPLPPTGVSQELPGVSLGPPALRLHLPAASVPCRGRPLPVPWGPLLVPLGIARGRD